MKRTTQSPMMITMLLKTAIASILICHAYAAERPNIILMLTDDQDVVLGGIEKMTNLKTLLAEKGTTFQNAFVHTPICCPSRSSILTGKYLHNLRVTNNSISGNCYGHDWQESSERNTYATFAKEAGYQTSYVGKYLNQYGYNENQNVPPGWDYWFGLVGNSCYYNYTIIESNATGPSKKVFHGNDYESDYLPDLLVNRTLEVLRKFTTSRLPFLHVLAWPTAHAPFTPAPQYEGAFESQTAPRTPNWNASCGDTKHWLVRQMQVIDDATQTRIDDIYQRRLETLLSVDEHIRLIVEFLESSGTLENTVVMYTSDNGFQLGQHCIADDKRQLYEHDIRVPFIVRGPMFGSGVTSDQIVLNIDIAPTIAELATGERQDRDMDGISFAPCRIHRRSDFLVSYHGEGAPPCGWYYECPKPDTVHGGDSWNNTYHCVRTISIEEDSIYCEFLDDENFVEYYDMNADQWQLTNKQLNQCQKRRYRQRLAQLKSCWGETCRRPAHLDLAVCS